MISELKVIEGLFSRQYTENERCPHVKRNDDGLVYCGSPNGRHKIQANILDVLCFSPTHSIACRFYKKPEA